jgi:hypothetical protein
MLTLKVFVEGAHGAGTSTVMRLLASQVSIEPERYSFGNDPSSLLRVVYAAGSFGGGAIRLEVTELSGAPSHWVTAMRARSDAVVLVVDSSADGVLAARTRFDELMIELMARSEADRPVTVVLAHQQDRPGAHSPADVARGIGCAQSTPVVGTSRALGGVQYGVALAVRNVLRAMDPHDGTGARHRHQESMEDLAQFLAASGQGSRLDSVDLRFNDSNGSIQPTQLLHASNTPSTSPALPPSFAAPKTIGAPVMTAASPSPAVVSSSVAGDAANAALPDPPTDPPAPSLHPTGERPPMPVPSIAPSSSGEPRQDSLASPQLMSSTPLDHADRVHTEPPVSATQPVTQPTRRGALSRLIASLQRS